PDGNTIYAVEAGTNSIAVIPLTGKKYQVAGLIPTAYEPHDITFSKDGTWMYIINGKSITGPNDGTKTPNTMPAPPGHLSSSTGAMIATYGSAAVAAGKSVAARASNTYQFQLEHASLVSAPVPSDNDLKHLTDVVAQNNFYNADDKSDRKTIDFLNSHIKHVIYIVKENRTFDQILGDLTNGANTDPSLNQFPKSI